MSSRFQPEEQRWRWHLIRWRKLEQEPSLGLGREERGGWGDQFWQVKFRKSNWQCWLGSWVCKSEGKERDPERDSIFSLKCMIILATGQDEITGDYIQIQKRSKHRALGLCLIFQNLGQEKGTSKRNWKYTVVSWSKGKKGFQEERIINHFKHAAATCSEIRAEKLLGNLSPGRSVVTSTRAVTVTWKRDEVAWIQEETRSAGDNSFQEQ